MLRRFDDVLKRCELTRREQRANSKKKMTITAAVPPEDLEVVTNHSFEELGVLGVNGTKVAEKAHSRVFHEPRSFEQPTETKQRRWQ